MDRQEYTEKVLAALPGLTSREKQAVQAEIDGHIEDHMEGLLELGYDEKLAEERTMAAMGDPEEVGRELNKQYPLGWLILQDVAAVFIAGLLILVLIYGGIYPGHFVESIYGRTAPSRADRIESAAWMEPADIRMNAGNDVIRIYEIGIHEGSAELYLCVYDRLPGGIPFRRINEGLYIKNQRGERIPISFLRYNTDAVNYYGASIPIKAGDTSITLCYDQYGMQACQSIPLPEVTP